MAAKVHSEPEGLDAPEFSGFYDKGFDSDGYFKACAEHRKRVAQWCKQNTNSKSPLVGETISFGVADGSAEYVVLDTNPLSLIHLRILDAYEVNPIMLRGPRVSDVKEMVRRSKALDKLFSREGQ